MKKIPSLLIGFLLISIVLHAQKKQPRFLAELSVGPSFPLGKFADKSFDAAEDNRSGLAKTGLGAQLSLGYYLNESAGILLLSGYSVHAQDASGYEDYVKTLTFNGNNNISRADVTTNSWKIIKVMAGGFLVTPLTSENELSMLTKVSAGICKTAVPKYSYTAYGDQSGFPIAWGYQGKTNLPVAFCYQVSVGLYYKLNNKLHMLLDINSFNATAKKEFSYFNTGNPTPGSNPSQTGTQVNKYKLASVNVLAGIGINF